jgi:hypothetical protein
VLATVLAGDVKSSSASAESVGKGQCAKGIEMIRHLPRIGPNPAVTIRNVYQYGSNNVKQMGRCLDDAAKDISK